MTLAFFTGSQIACLGPSLADAIEVKVLPIPRQGPRRLSSLLPDFPLKYSNRIPSIDHQLAEVAATYASENLAIISRSIIFAVRS